MIPKKWKQRTKALSKIEKGMEKEILKVYADALKEIRNDLALAYEKYDMNMVNMQKYNRLIKLEGQIIDEIKNLSNKSKRSINKGLKTLYQEGYYQTSFILETELQTKLAYTMLDAKAIERAVMNSISGLKWTERMGLNRDNTIAQIKQELARGLIQGEGYQKMARRMRNRLEVDMNKTLRIARTEGHRVIEESSYDSLVHAENMGIKAKKRWVATLDERTRSSHQHLDGETVDIGDRFSNGLLYPGEASGPPEEIINCRCTTITVFEGLEPTERRIRGEGIVPYTNYQDWKKNRLGG